MEKNQQTPGIWFIYYKKRTGEPTVAYEEAVEEALNFGGLTDQCPGWGTLQQVITRRKAGSMWSKQHFHKFNESSWKR